ncbi:MAG: hypothetical protein RJS97_00115 [Parvibaculaceae bacterium]
MYKGPSGSMNSLFLFVVIVIGAVGGSYLWARQIAITPSQILADDSSVTVFDHGLKTKIKHNVEVSVTAWSYFEPTNSRVVIELRRTEDSDTISAQLRISNLILKPRLKPIPINARASVFVNQTTMLVVDLNRNSESYRKWSEGIKEIMDRYRTSGSDETMSPILEIDEAWYK